MGLSNGNVGPSSNKGITGPVTVNGVGPVKGWTHTWPLAGEHNQWFSPVGAGSIDTPVTAVAPSANASLLWFKAVFALPPSTPAATQVYACVYACASMCMPMHAHACVCVSVCMHVYACIHICTHVYACVRMCTHAHACVCVCMCMHGYAC